MSVTRRETTSLYSVTVNSFQTNELGLVKMEVHQSVHTALIFETRLSCAKSLGNALHMVKSMAGFCNPTRQNLIINIFMLNASPVKRLLALDIVDQSSKESSGSNKTGFFT